MTAQLTPDKDFPTKTVVPGSWFTDLQTDRKTIARCFYDEATPDLPSAIDALLAAPEPVLDAPVLAAAAADAPPVAAVATSVPEAETAAADAAPVVVAAAVRADDNVLDDLESWLSTLHDRSTE